MNMTNREIADHIDAFKYWCETNEENGVITIPKFLCEHIVEILDDTNARPHGELTKESAIDYLTETGWLPEHDRILTKRSHGEWEFIGENLFKCTHCGYVADADYLRKWKVHSFDMSFPTSCLKCGADMRDKKDDLAEIVEAAQSMKNNKIVRGDEV